MLKPIRNFESNNVMHSLMLSITMQNLPSDFMTFTGYFPCFRIDFRPWFAASSVVWFFHTLIFVSFQQNTDFLKLIGLFSNICLVFRVSVAKAGN